MPPEPYPQQPFDQGQFQGRVLSDLAYLKENLSNKVDRDEFAPVKAIAYTIVSVVGLGVLSALIATVVKAATTIITNVR